MVMFAKLSAMKDALRALSRHRRTCTDISKCVYIFGRNFKLVKVYCKIVAFHLY